MLLQKTEKARDELRPGSRSLGLRERSMLLLADGNKSMTDFQPMWGGEGEQIVLRLVRDGYLVAVNARPGFRPESTGTFAVSTGVFSAQALAPQAASDNFAGKRSLATTRMFLFDICERMFARRDPALAERFREALREAKDRASMLEASREMITEIEKAAGAERADSISERIAMLLPPED